MRFIASGALFTLVGLAVATPRPAHAFCGFYVAGADAKLYNNATLVVMMRDGTRTVLAMQNNYEGPPENFAMVVPVPVVLQKENVKTLPADVFGRVDALAAPRLVEYWEQDPCNPRMYMDDMVAMSAAPMEEAESAGSDRDLGVKIEAQFKVGEYEIVILSAQDSTGLDTWLRRERYRIPDGAEPLLRPYVASGMKFFVAKVDIKKVQRQNGRITLAPLRFHYDSQQFNLPIRLGLINAAGAQDLIVHILAPNQRYELANYQNVTIPTNLDVSDDTRQSFGTFYAALFDATLARHPGSVVTEYSWDAASCDPCPTPPLEANDLATLGADVISPDRGFVLTRLHARYTKDTLRDDLVFRAADAIMGGREVRQGPNNDLERGAAPTSFNNFQARYIIRHPWQGAITCENPQRGIWGGPPGEGDQPKLEAARDTAFAPRGGDISLATYLRQDVDEIDYKVSEGDPNSRFKNTGIPGKNSSCAGCQGSGGPASAALAFLLALGGLGLFRRRSRASRAAGGRS